MVVPFAPGGVYDTIGRVYAAALADILATPVVVENVPGAGSMTGSTRVARADPDGYQLLLGGESSNAQVQLLHNAPAYDAAKDFAPIALVAQHTILLDRSDTQPDPERIQLRELTRSLASNGHRVTVYTEGGSGPDRFTYWPPMTPNPR